MVHRLSSETLIAAVLVASCPACERTNPNYCEGNPNNDCRAAADATTDVAEPGCTSSAACAAPTPACETGSGTCVQCIAPGETDACNGVTPVCDADHTCRACESHAECASGACLPTGACATPSEVAYVSATGSGTACTQASPCPLLADALGKNLPYVKEIGRASCRERV